ncbi:alpha/beta fold hydrolase [Chitinophaga tropicalis]|uniref:Alpha/beta hydrolase n=1 Tax=Chitinophaga tropicalis TaxID=2683588 RepID=A0A7K1UB81_9BACT|nr:alpha/beta hydrolase [Chitinophaga tropicalis]MVT11642.1 alpha/beta hydrolase [Chitinophaga tropicalis]
MEKHIYLISGMGADQRIFNNLLFPEGYIPHYLEWLTPGEEESYIDYAARMAARIEHENVSLLGVSFGGMLSLEIARQRPINKTILISSIKQTSEKPSYLNLVRRTGLLRLLNLPDAIIFKNRGMILRYFLHAETPEEKQLLTDYLNKTSYDYLRWSIRQVVNWQNDFLPEGLVHIHGGKDMSFPIRFVRPDYTIPTGGHLMVLNRAAEINEILKKELP